MKIRKELAKNDAIIKVGVPMSLWRACNSRFDQEGNGEWFGRIYEFVEELIVLW